MVKSNYLTESPFPNTEQIEPDQQNFILSLSLSLYAHISSLYIVYVYKHVWKYINTYTENKEQTKKGKGPLQYHKIQKVAASWRNYFLKWNKLQEISYPVPSLWYSSERKVK